MAADAVPAAIRAMDAPPRARPSWYPGAFAKLMEGRTKRLLGDLFGLSNFGVNIVHLAPGARSALRHAHTRQDEFVYVVEGEPTLVTDAGDTPLKPGMCAGFKAGTGNAHHLVNRSARDVVYLEIGAAPPATRSTIPRTISGCEPAPTAGSATSARTARPIESHGHCEERGAPNQACHCEAATGRRGNLRRAEARCLREIASLRSQ